VRFARLTLAVALALGTAFTHAQTAGRIKVSLMLPATGAFAALGTAIDNGRKLNVAEQATSFQGARSSS
jgi:branched-chain amino acid transport system substrate-binding protein